MPKKRPTSTQVNEDESDDGASTILSPRPTAKKRRVLTVVSPPSVSSTSSSKKKPAPAKKVPVAKVASSNPLAEIRIVISGITEYVNRDKLEAQLKQAGASVTSAVSGKTNILLIGEKLEDGRLATEGLKYKKARELIENGKNAGLRILKEKEFFEDEFPFLLAAKESEDEDMLEKTDEGTASVDDATRGHTLWAEAHRPKAKSSMAFNTVAYDAVVNWLHSWSADSKTEKGCLLVGPPGVGKTTVAYLATAKEGFEILEFNASDTRSQVKLRTLMPLISGGCVLGGSKKQRVVILFDEADGLSIGDRGGAVAMSGMIQVSKVPIICTANEKTNKKVSPIVKTCKVVQFTKPTRLEAIGRLSQITKKEGHQSVPKELFESLYESTDGDMRQMITFLQSRLSSRRDAKEEIGFLKDVGAFDDPFVAVKHIFASAAKTESQRLNAFFLDYSLVPLIMFENWGKVATASHATIGTALEVAAAFGLADECNAKMRRSMSDWKLLPYIGYLTTVLPSKLMRGAMYRVDFPKLYGKMSSAKKNVNLLLEIGLIGGRSAHLDGVNSLLARKLCNELKKANDEALDNFLDTLEECGVTKDQFSEGICRLGAFGKEMSQYDLIETRVKTQLTKRHKLRSEAVASKKGKRTPASKRALVMPSTPSVSVKKEDPEEDPEKSEEDMLQESEEDNALMKAMVLDDNDIYSFV